jgi:hypothetical protein
MFSVWFMPWLYNEVLRISESSVVVGQKFADEEELEVGQ